MNEVLVDQRFRVAGLRSVDVTNTGELCGFVEEFLASGGEVLTVVGDDATLAAVATVRHEYLRARAEPLSYALLAAGELSTVADFVGASPVSKRALSRAAKLESGRGKRVPTIRVVDSGRPIASLAFGVGLGAIADLVLGSGRLRRRDAVRKLGATALDLDITVNWERQTDEIGYILASSLTATWGGIAMGDGLTLRTGSSPAGLLRATSRLGHFVEQRAGAGYVSASAIHIDGNSDYVVDGLVRTSDYPRTLALTEGPQLRVLTV